ncbi:MAG: hypothetical protein NBV63_00545 [Candidatus Pacebacteria bacterium]|nr:hypothetical protein [Candidatus Paceibacterota bacterium]
MRLTLLIFSLVIASVMAVVQYIALVEYWYWQYWWLDIAMHAAGGALLMCIGLALGLRRALALIVFVGGISLAWEVYEFALGISVHEEAFLSDTTLDLVMDTLGALVVYGMMRQWLRSQLPLPAVHGVSPGQTSSSP